MRAPVSEQGTQNRHCTCTFVHLDISVKSTTTPNTTTFFKLSGDPSLQSKSCQKHVGDVEWHSETQTDLKSLVRLLLCRGNGDDSVPGRLSRRLSRLSSRHQSRDAPRPPAQQNRPLAVPDGPAQQGVCSHKILYTAFIQF